MFNKYKYRKLILDSYLNNDIDRETAISRMDVSNRQFCRILKRYKEEGADGLTHRLSNRPSNHRLSDIIRQEIIAAYAKDYEGWNYVHTSEKLALHQNIKIHCSTLRNLLLSQNITQTKYKRKKYFKRRERKARFGELVQLDGSIHDWLGDGRHLCLMHFVDDATGMSFALLCDGENVESAYKLLYEWCCRYGVPQSIYSDHDSVYKVNPRVDKLTIDEQLSGQKEALTKFGKLCKSLGIRQIFANTPQAKGRVERKHFLYQDRLVKEIKLYGLKTIAEVNEYLLRKDGFIDQINRKFTVEAKECGSACLMIDPKDLYSIFTIEEIRCVRNDYTIRFKNQVYQLAKDRIINTRSKVIVKTYLDGSIAITTVNGQNLKFTQVNNYHKAEIIIKEAESKSKQATVGIKKISPWRTFTPKRKQYPTTKKGSTMAYLDDVAKYYG